MRCYYAFMSKSQIVFEIVMLLQGTPLDDFARRNFAMHDGSAVVLCATSSNLSTPEGAVCKSGVAKALRRYSYRFTKAQIDVLAELYVNALDHLEPDALARVRDHMCDPMSEAAERDAAAARAVCERLSLDY